MCSLCQHKDTLAGGGPDMTAHRPHTAHGSCAHSHHAALSWCPDTSLSSPHLLHQLWQCQDVTRQVCGVCLLADTAHRMCHTVEHAPETQSTQRTSRREWVPNTQQFVAQHKHTATDVPAGSVTPTAAPAALSAEVAVAGITLCSLLGLVALGDGRPRAEVR